MTDEEVLKLIHKVRYGRPYRQEEFNAITKILEITERLLEERNDLKKRCRSIWVKYWDTVNKGILVAQYEARISKAKKEIEAIAKQTGQSIPEAAADYSDKMRAQAERKIQANAWGTGLNP